MGALDDMVDRLTEVAADPKAFKRTRRRAALRLSQTPISQAAAGLALAAVNSGDEHVAALALKRIAATIRQDDKDAICEVWRRHRNSLLADAITERRWVASTPPDLRVLTALHIDDVEALAPEDPEVVRALLAAAVREAPPLSVRAREALTGLADRGARDALCEMAIQVGDPLALKIAIANDFADDPSRRALLHFLAGEFERYAELDFDARLLAAFCGSADTPLRMRLAEQARASARVDWIRAITQSTGAERSEEAWAATVDVLQTAGHPDELWRMVFESPPVWGARLLRGLDRDVLREIGVDPDEAAELEAIASACAEFDPHDARANIVIDRPKGADGRSLALAPLGDIVAEGNLDRSVEIWRLPSGERTAVLPAHHGHWTRMVVTPDSELLISDGVNGVAELWRLSGGAHAGNIDTGDRATTALAVPPDGALLASGDTLGGVHLNALPSGRLLGISAIEEGMVEELAFSRDGQMLVGRSSQGGVAAWTVTAEVRAGARERLPRVMLDRAVGATSLAVAPDGKRLAAGALDGRLRLWRLPFGDPAEDHCRMLGAITALAFSPDGRTLISGCATGLVTLHRPAEGTRIDKTHGHTGPVVEFATSADGRLFASGGKEGVVRLWDLPTGESIGIVARHEGGAQRVLMTPNGRVVASSGADRRIRAAFTSAPALARKPLARIGLAEVERERAEHSGAPGAFAWYDLIIALLRHRHRHDIGVAEATPGPPVDTDIELDGG
jgi:hypothetical protein